MLEKIEKELKKYNKTSSKRFIIAIEWFDNTYAKMNSDECHLFITGNKFEDLWVKIGKNRIWENRTVKHLGITIYNELSVCVCVCVCVCVYVCVCVCLFFHREGLFRLQDVGDILEEHGSTILCCE